MHNYIFIYLFIIYIPWIFLGIDPLDIGIVKYEQGIH